MSKILVEGRPGSGKTTVARRMTESLRSRGRRVAGFFTEEIREDGTRVGFAIETVAGERGILAHVDFPGPPRVGKYGVDLESFERIALDALEGAQDAEFVVIDELGKMELASESFTEAVDSLLQGDVSVVATVHAHGHPFTDELKGRPDVETVRITRSNRDELPGRLLEELGLP